MAGAYLQLSNASFYWSRNEQMEHGTDAAPPVAGKKFCIIYVGAAHTKDPKDSKDPKEKQRTSTRPTDLNAIALKYVVGGGGDPGAIETSARATGNIRRPGLRRAISFHLPRC